VLQYLGVVTAQGVLGVNACQDVGAGMRTMLGGRSRSWVQVLWERAGLRVSDALAALEQQGPSWAPTRSLAWTRR
jgi:uncharacterized protein YbjQ (UPF0145 family)